MLSVGKNASYIFVCKCVNIHSKLNIVKVFIVQTEINSFFPFGLTKIEVDTFSWNTLK